MPLKILLADDSHVTLNIGKKILTDAGFDVTTAAGGDAAVEKLSKLKPDLIVLDAYMPGFDGFELCRALKSVRRTARVPIVLTAGKLEPLFSGDSTGADDGAISQFVQKRLFARFRNRGSAAKADAILRKPFDATDLVYVVQQLTHLGSLPAGATAGKTRAGKEKPALQRLTSGWVIILREPKLPDELVVSNPASTSKSDRNTYESLALETFLPSQPPELSEILSEDVQLSEIHALFPEAAEIDFTLAEPIVIAVHSPGFAPAPIVAPSLAAEDTVPLSALVSADGTMAPDLVSREELAAPAEHGLLNLQDEEAQLPEASRLRDESDWLPVPRPETGFDWQPRSTEQHEVLETVERPIDGLETSCVWAPVGTSETGFDWAPRAPFADEDSELAGPTIEPPSTELSLPAEYSPMEGDFTAVELPQFECAPPEMPAPVTADLETKPQSTEELPILAGPDAYANEHHELPPSPQDFGHPELQATSLSLEPENMGEPVAEVPPHLDFLRDAIAEASEHDVGIKPVASVPEPVEDDCTAFEEPVLEVNRDFDEGPWGGLPSRTETPPSLIRRATVREEWVRFIPAPRPVQAESPAAVASGSPVGSPMVIPAAQGQQADTRLEPSELALSSRVKESAQTFKSSDRQGNESRVETPGKDDQATLDLDLLALSLIPEPVQEEDSYATAQETAAGLNSGPMEEIDLERFLTPEAMKAETPTASSYSNYRPSEGLVQSMPSAEEEEPVPIAFDLAKYLALSPISPVEMRPPSNSLGPSALFSEPPLGATAEQMVDEALERIRPGLIEEARRMLAQNSDTTGSSK